MRISRFFRASLLLVVLAAGLSLSPVAAAQTSYAGKLLVASPDMPDPRFADTVIYICRHDENGTLGLVLNRPAGTMALAELMQSLQLDHAREAKGAIEVRRGGPVEPGTVYVLHSDDFASKGVVCQDGGGAVSSSPDVLEALAANRGPRHAILILGYAGWEPDQLEGEIMQGGWDVVSSDAKFLFETRPGDMWRRARERRSRDL